MPRKGDETLQQYLEKYTKKTGLWSNYPKYLVSTLKAYYGKNATAQNDFGYGFLPKLTGNHSFFEFLYDMLDGKIRYPEQATHDLGLAIAGTIPRSAPSDNNRRIASRPRSP